MAARFVYIKEASCWKYHEANQSRCLKGWLAQSLNIYVNERFLRKQTNLGARSQLVTAAFSVHNGCKCNPFEMCSCFITSLQTDNSSKHVSEIVSCVVFSRVWSLQVTFVSSLTRLCLLSMHRCCLYLWLPCIVFFIWKISPVWPNLAHLLLLNIVHDFF